MIYPTVSFSPFLLTPLCVFLSPLLSFSPPFSQSTKNDACSSFILIITLPYYLLKSLVSCLFLSSSFSPSYSLSWSRRKPVFLPSSSSSLFLLVCIVFLIHPVHYPVDCKKFSSSRTSFFSSLSPSPTFPSSSFSFPSSTSFLSSSAFPLNPSLFSSEIFSETSTSQSPLLSRPTASIIPFSSYSSSTKDRSAKKGRIARLPRYRGLPPCCFLSLSSSPSLSRRRQLLAGSILPPHRHAESRLSFSFSETGGRWKEGEVDNFLFEKKHFVSSSLSGSHSKFRSYERKKKKNIVSFPACMSSLKEVSSSSSPLRAFSSSSSSIHHSRGRVKPHLFLHPFFKHFGSISSSSSNHESSHSSSSSSFLRSSPVSMHCTPDLSLSSSSFTSSSSSLHLNRLSFQSHTSQTHHGKLLPNSVTFSPSFSPSSFSSSSFSSSSSSSSSCSFPCVLSSSTILSSPILSSPFFSRSSSTSLLSSSSSSPPPPSSSLSHSSSVSSKASPESRTFSLFSSLLRTLDEDISSLSSAVTQVITAKRKSSSSSSVPFESSRNDRSATFSGVYTPQLVSGSSQETRKGGDRKRESLTFCREQVNRLFLSLSGIAHSLLTFSSSLHSFKDSSPSHLHRISPLYFTAEEKKEKNNLPSLLNGLSVELKKVLHRLLSLDRYLTAAYRAEETFFVTASTEGKRLSSSFSQNTRSWRETETEKRVRADQGKEEEKRREGEEEELRENEEEREEEKDIGGYIGVYVEYVAYMLGEISKKKVLLSLLHAQKGKGIETAISLSLIQDLEESLRSLQKVRQPRSLALLFQKYWRVLQESYDLPSKEKRKKTKEEEERGERSIVEGEIQKKENAVDRGGGKEEEEVREEEERRAKEVYVAEEDRTLVRDDQKEGQAEKEEEEGQEERGEEEIQRQEKKEKQSESSDRYFFQTLLRLVQEGRFLVRDFLQQQPQRFHKERKKDEENSNLIRRRRSNSHDHREQERDECFLDHEVYIHPRDGKKTFLTGLYDHDGANGFTSSTSSILSSLSETSTSFSSHKEVDTERPEISFESSDNLLKDEKEIFDTTSTSCRFRGERDAFSWSLPSLRNRKEKLALQDLLHPLPPLLPQELREIAMSLFDSGVHTPQVEKIVYQHLQPYTYQTPSTLHVDRPLQQEPSVSAEEIFQPKTAFQDHEMQGKKVDEEEDKEKKQMRREGEEEEDAEEEEEEKEKRKKERHLSPCHTDNFDEEKQAKEEEEEEEIFWSRLFLRKYAEEGQWYRAFDKLRKSVNLVTPHLQDLSYRRIPFKTQVNEDEEERSLSTEKEMKKKIEDGDGGREESRPGKESFDQAGAFLLFEEIKTEMNLKEEKEEAKRYEVKERKELENKKKDHEDDKEFKNEKREHEEGRMARRREILERIYKDISLVMSVCIEKEQYVKAAEALALLPSFERNVFPSLFPSFFFPDDHSLPSLSSSTSDDSSSSSPSYPSLLSMTVEACYRLFEMLEERKMKNKIKTSLLHEKKNVFSKTDIHPFRASVQDSIKASSSLSLPSLSSEEVEVREEISPMLDGNGLFSQECSSRLCLRDRERNGLHPVSSPQQDLSEMIVAHAARFLLFQLQSWQGEVHRSIKLLELEEDHDKEDEREGREGIQKGKEISKIDDRKEVCERLSPSRSLCSGVHTDERFDRMKERKKKFLKISLQYLQKQISLLKERLDHIELETSLDLLPERGRRAEKKGSSPFATFPVQESDKQEKTAAGKEQRDQDRQERELTKRKEDGEMTKREKESENEEEETVSPSLSVPSIDRRDILSSYVEGQRRKSMIDVYKEKKRKEFDLRVKNLDEVLKLLEEGERSLLSPLHYHHEEKGKTVSIHHEHPRSLLRRIRQCQDLKSILPLIRLYLSSSASSLGLSRRSTSNSKKEEDEEEREGMGDEITRKRSRRRRRRRESEDAVEQDKVVQLHHIMVELLRVLHEENGTLSSSACRSSRLIDGEDQGGVYEKGGQEEEQDRSSKIARGQEEKKNHKEKEGKDCSMVAKDAFLKIFDQLLLSLLPPADRKHPSPSFSSSLQAKADRSLHSPSPHQKSVYTPQHHISYSYISTAISLALWNDFRRLQHFLSSLSSSSSTSSAHLSHQTSPSSFPLHLLPSIAGITALLFQLINPRRDPSTSVKAEEEERRKKNEERLLMHAISLIEKTSPELLHLSLEHQQSLPQPLQFLLAHIKSLQRKRKEEEERARQMSSSSSSDDKRHPSIMKFTRQTLIDEPSLHAQNKSLSASSHISPSIQLSPISSFSSDTEDHRSSSSSPPGLNLSVISPFSSSIYEEVEDTPALHAAKSAISSLYVKGPEEIVKEILEALKKRKFARGGKEDSKVFSKILELVLLVRCETTRLMKIVQKNTQEETEGQAEGESKQTDEARRRRGGHARSSSIHPVLWRERKRIIRLYTEVLQALQKGESSSSSLPFFSFPLPFIELLLSELRISDLGSQRKHLPSFSSSSSPPPLSGDSSSFSHSSGVSSSSLDSPHSASSLSSPLFPSYLSRAYLAGMRSFSACISGLLSPSNSIGPTTVSETSSSCHSKSSLRRREQKEEGEDKEEVERERWKTEEGKEEEEAGRGLKMEKKVRDRCRAYAVLSSAFEMFQLMKDTGMDLHDPIYASLLKAISKTPSSPSSSSSLSLSSLSSSLPLLKRDKHLPSSFFSSFSSFPPLVQSLLLLKAMLKRHPSIHSPSSSSYHFDPPSSSRVDIRCFNYALTTAARHHPQRSLHFSHSPSSSLSSSSPSSSSLAFSSSSFLHLHRSLGSISKTSKPSEAFQLWRAMQEKVEEEASTKKRKEKKTTDEGEEGEGVEELEGEGAWSAEWIVRQLHASEGLVRPNSITLTTALQAFRNANNTPLSPLLKSYLPSSSSLATSYEGVPQLKSLLPSSSLYNPKKEDSFSSSSSSTYSQERPVGGSLPPSHFGRNRPLREAKEEEEGEEEEVSCSKEREERRVATAGEGRSFFVRPQMIDIPLLNALIHCKAIEGDLEGIEAILDMKRPIQDIVEEDEEKSQDLPRGEEIRKKKNGKILQIYGMFDDVTFKNLLFAASKAHRPHKSEEYLERQIAHGIPPGIQHWNQLFKAYVGRLRDISEGVQEEGGQEEKNTRHLGRERRGTGRESSNRRKEEGHEEGRKEGEEKGRDVSTKEVLHGEEKRNGEKKMAEEINFSESSMSLDEEEEVRKLISRVIEVYRHLNTDGPFPGMKTFLIVNRALASGVSAARQVMLNQKRKPSSSSFSPFASSFLSTLAKKAAETSVQVARDYQQSLLQGNLHTQLTTLLSSSSSLSSSFLREKVPRMGVGERLDGEEVSDRIEVYWQLFFNPWIFGEAMKACLASPPRRWGRTKAGGGGGEEGKDREVLEIFLDLLLPARNQFLRSFFHREKIFSSLHAETTKRTKEKEKTNLTEEEEERESLERKEALRDMNHQQDLAVSLSSPREEEDEEEEDKKEMDKYLSLLPPSLGLLPIGICELLIEALKNLYRRFSISNKESFLSLEEDREEEEEEKKKKIMNDREIDRERREKKDDEEEEPVKRRRREKEREEVKILMKKAFIAMLQEWSRKIFTLDGGLHRIYEDLFLEGEDEEKKKMKSRSGDSKGILSSASWHTEESQEGKKKRWSERRSDEDEGKSALKEEKARKKIERNIKEKMNLVRLPTELLPFDIRQEETEENEEDEEEDGGFSDERARKLLKEKSRKEREGSKQNTLASQEEGEEEFPFSSSSSFISRAPSIGMKLKRRLLDQLRSSSSFDEAKSVYGELHYYGQEERMFTLGPGDREVLYRHLLRLAPHPVDALSFYISLPSHSKRRSIMTSSKRKDLETFSRKAHSSPLLRQPSTQHDEKKSGDIFFNSTKEREERERTAGEEARDHTGEAIVEEEQEKERKEEEEEWAVVTSSSSPVERVPLSFLKAAIGKAIEVARQSEKESGRLLDLLPFLLKSPYPSASFLSPCLCLKILEHLAKSETSPSSSSSSFSSSSLSSSSLFSSAKEKKDRECGGGGGETGDGILQFLEKSLEVLYVLHDDHEDGERKKKKNVSDLLMKEEEGGEEELSITRKDLELSAMRALGQTGSWRQAISLLHLRLQSLFGSPSSLSSSSPSFSSSSSSLSSLSILSSSAWSSPPPLAWWIEAKRAAEKAERPEIAKSLEILTRYKFAVGKEEIEKDRKKTEKEEEKILKSLLKEFLEGEGDARDKEDAFLKKLKKNQMMNSDLLASVVKKALEEEKKKKKYMGSRAEDKPSLFHIAEKLSTDRDKSEEEDHEDLMKEKKKKRDFLVGGGEEEEGEKRSKKNIFGEEVSKYTVLYKLEKLLDLPDLKKRNPYGDTIKRKSNKPKIKKKKKNKEE